VLIHGVFIYQTLYGWVFKIKLSNPAELNALLSPEDYKKQIGG
jgi:glycine cleavage system H lipoate-binding protein